MKNALDVASIALDSGPGSVHFAQMVRGGFTVSSSFGDPDGDTVTTALTLSGSGEVRAPCNVTVRVVPDLSGDALSSEEKRVFADLLRPLRHADGTRVRTSELAEGDLVLSVWPAAYRNLEYLYSALEVPVPDASGGSLPQFAVPRLWWLRGVSASSLGPAIAAEVARQFTGGTPPDTAEFLAGRGEVYVPTDALLGSASGRLEVRCFDGAGLPVDANAVFGTYRELAHDVGEHYAKPDPATARSWSGPRRVVMVFSDHVGAPYAPFEDTPPPGVFPAPPTEAPLRRVNVDGVERDIPAHGVVVIPADSSAEYASLTDGVVNLTMDGAGVRLGTHPHGQLSDQPSVSVQDWSFLRLRVLDYHRWFPRNPNPANATHDGLARYTEGNAYLPLADGKPTFRHVYRAIRSTHREERYEGDADMPDGDSRDGTGFQVLLNNAWYSPHTPLLGRRAMTLAPRTQPGAMQQEDDPIEPGQVPWSPSDFVAKFSPVPSRGFPSAEPSPPPSSPSATDPDVHRTWYWVTPPGALPPGAWIRLRQLDADSKHVGSDPSDPAAIGAIDLFGRLELVSTPSAFVGPGGQAVLAIDYDPDWAIGGDRIRCEALVVTWDPDDGDDAPGTLLSTGKGLPRERAYGVIEVALPGPDPLSPSAFANASVDLVVGAHLERTAAAGGARVVLPAGMVTGPVTVAVLNPRCGDVFWRRIDAAPTNAVHVEMTNFAMQDGVLVGFLENDPALPEETDAAGPLPDLTACTHLFPLSFSREAKIAGQVPAHPKESLGLAREAIDANVDVRLLAWRDDTGTTKDQLGRSLGGVNGVNAVFGATRGQAILDGITRATASHHQKPAFVLGPDGPVAFVGGIDQSTGRYAERGHPAVDPDRPGGLWHDIHSRIEGKAALDVYRNFRDRWNAWLAHPEIAEPGGTAAEGFDPADPGLTPLPEIPATGYEPLAKTDGPHTVQINRTIPPSVEEYDGFLDPGVGDLSILASYERVFEQAKRFLYIEDQYFFNVEFAQKLNQRLHEGSLDFVMLLLPRFLSETAYVDLILYAIRRRALSMLLYGTEELPAEGSESSAPQNVRDKVAVFHIDNDHDEPVYVHCKYVTADDLWMSIGSSNLNQRSMSYDSELNAAMIDTRLRRGGHRTVRAFRADLLAEHLRLEPWETPLVEDPYEAFDRVKAVLEGRDSRATNLVAADLRLTHYGIQPADMDGDFLAALAIAFDPDGRVAVPGSDEHPARTASSMSGRLLTVAMVLHMATEDEADPGFSRFGYLKVTTGVPAALDPTQLQVTFEVWRDEPGAEHVFTGPFSATEPANLGLLETGVAYRLTATATDPTAPEVPVAMGTIGPFDTPSFDNHQLVDLSLV